MNKMNQTQTRSPRKRLLSLILAVILVIGLLPISAFATAASAQADEDKDATQASEFLRIFHLDCGRKYFTVSEIEGIIDQLAENHFTHLQLAFGNDGLRFLLDDMSLTVNGKDYSSADVTSAIQYGNQQYYNAGSKNELTQSDMDTIIEYANGKGISIIPMFNAPYHVNALLTAMQSKLNITDARKTFAIKDDDGKITYKDTYLNLESQDAVAFVKALQAKYAAYFAGKGSTYFNFGADEYYFKGLDDALYTKFATFVNDLAGIVKNNKMIPMAYNDGFYFGSLTLQGDVKFDTDIRICYWAEGDGRASAETLAGEGFQIINNSNDWYYVLGDYLYKAWGEASGQWGYYDALNGLKNTKVLQVKGDSNGAVTPIGSVLCFWCDYPSVSYTGYGYKATNQTNQQSVYSLIKAMAENNPDYFKETTPVLAPVGGTVSPVKQADGSYNVAVAADDTVRLNLSNASNVSWSSSDETVATVDDTGLVTFTGKPGTVKITAQIPPATRADAGASYTVTFNVTEKGAPIEVTVAVGRTVKETLQGEQTTISGDSNYSEYVTVTAEHKTTTAGKKLLEITSAEDLVDGEYLIANQRMGVINKSNQLLTTDTAYWGSNRVLALSGAPATDSTVLWTITKTNSGYTLKNGSYLNIGNNTASVSSTNRNLTLACQKNDGTVTAAKDYPAYYWNISYNGYYLNALGGETGAGGWQYTSNNDADIDIGSRWTIYRIVEEEASSTTTVSFTGVQVGGPVTVTVGDTTYSVTVVEKQNVEIPISIIDYRADGLLFDWSYYPKNQGGQYYNSYRYGLVHSYAYDWGTGDGNGVNANTNADGNLEVSGTADGVEKIEGTLIQRTGNANTSTKFYPNGTDNDWSRAGLVQKDLGSNGMPVYTDAAVKYVASLLAKGYYNDVSDSQYSCNTLLKETFLTEGKPRSVLTDTAPTNFSENFKNAKTYANISNAYDLAWYLLNTIYQADTNMTTVTGTDGQTYSVPIYGMAVDTYKSIVLTPNEDGTTYSFEAGYQVKDSSGNVTFDYPAHIKYDQTAGTIYEDASEEKSYAFYPLDGLGYEQSGLLTKTSAIDSKHNGNFTLRGESQFVYKEASNLYFTFTGDDDVYMYINGVLALDLGGAHGRNTKTVNLNDLDPEKYGLVEGQVATFTFFYMERCSDASTFGIKTNMELVQRAIDVEKKAYDTSYGAEYADGASISTTLDNPTTVAYDLILTNKGNTDMNQISFTDDDTQGGKAAFGYSVDNPYVEDSNTAIVTLGHLNTYLIYVTDGDKEVENTRKTLTTLNELSEEVGKVTLAPGQSLHVRFLTATFNVPNATIQDYTNTVYAKAYTKGSDKPLEDNASHELYSYNASDTGRTYVVDFGLPLEIHDIFNEAAKPYIGDVTYNPGKNDLKYGTVDHVVSAKADTTLTYTRTADKTIDGAEKIVLDVQYTMDENTVTLDKTLTIIPASNVYYEDSLATFTNGAGAAEDATWSIVGDDGNEGATEDTTTTQALQQLGDKAIYGYDDAYNEANSSMLSMGTAHKVTVTAKMLEDYNKDNTDNFAWPTAQFTFKGTGFDIISLTDNTSGAIVVDVYEGSKTEGSQPKYSYLVNNYYGYTYNQETQKWEVVKDGKENAIYQIPVMKVNDLPYGEYTAVIEVFYNSFFDMNYDENSSKNQYSFWLDAVRIYDPMGEYAGYTEDNEGYPQYIKLRDTLADGTAKPEGTNQTVFIDGGSTADIKTTYANLGPNNEVYLMNGQAITFKLTGDTGKIASIQIGAKAPKGAVELKVNDSMVVENLSTATEMYYDITDYAKNGSTVTITNTTGNILSLTNLKITFKEKPTGKITLAALDTQEQETAVNLVRALFTAPVATFSPETFQADWGRAVRAGKRATLTVKTSADVESIKVDGQTITGYTTRTERTGWGWWSPKVTYHVFTYTITAPAQTTDYTVCAVNAEGTASEAVTATLTVKPTTWWNWWF